MAEALPAAVLPRKRFRWWTGLTILVVGAIIQAVLWNHWDDDVTYQVFSLYYILPSVSLLLALWWLVQSRFSWKLRLSVLGGIVLGIATFFVLYGIEMDGAMRWQLRPRWWGPDDPDQAYFENLKAETPPEVERVKIDSDDWPRFRGHDSAGVVRDSNINLDWKTHPPKQLWRHRVKEGWSSFAVVDGLAFTQEQRDEGETVVCYDVRTGKEYWTHTDDVKHATVMGGVGPRATPTVYGGRVYTLGATGILNCLDPIDGDLFWSTNIIEDAGARLLDWGMAGSPLVFDDLCIVNPGSQGHENSGKSVVAYDRKTGKIKWTSGNDYASYSAPKLTTIEGEQQILLMTGEALVSYRPKDGKELWRYGPWTNPPKVNVAQPIVRGRQVFISSGYQTGSALLEIHKDGDSWTVKEVWRQPNRFKLKFNDGVYKDGYVYGLDESFLSCIDYLTGRRQWKIRDSSFGYGQVLLVNDLLLISGEKGDVILYKASPERDEAVELARFTAFNDGEVQGIGWNQPAIYRGLLLLRHNREAACYDLRIPPPEKAAAAPVPAGPNQPD